ncbi:MAG: hypothetical protein WCD43_14585 [Candidatus Acidiferrales bacterium]
MPANLDVASFAFAIYETKTSPHPLRRDVTATADACTETFQPQSRDYRWHLLRRL